MQINWIGYKFLQIDGYGRASLACIKNLINIGVEVRPHTVDVLEQPAWFQKASGLDFSRATICLMPAYEMKPIPGLVLNYTMWEATKLEDRWRESANEYCKVMIVPSEFLVEVMKNNGIKVPIEVAKMGIDPDECPLMLKKPNSDRPFTFMCLGDRGNRKGQDIVWQAFYKAFGKSRDVRLVIKCRPGNMTYLDMTTSDPRISLWRCDVDHVGDTYMFADCYVFPTRGEGYGMTPREAAACGVPTITTRWGGTADDIDNYAIPINNFKMSVSNLPANGLWAEPDVDEVTAHMKWVYENQERAFKEAHERALWLRTNRTWRHTAERLVQIVEKWY